MIRNLRFIRAASILTIAAAIQTAAAEKSSALLQLPGYTAVPVWYGPGDKMLMHATVNGHSAKFIIDTGASVSILEAKRAKPLGVAPVGAESPFGQFAVINQTPFRVGFVSSLKAGNMDFGGGPIALFDSNSSNMLSMRTRHGTLNVDGVIGADILTRYKAVIHCRAKVILFKTDGSRRLELARYAMSQNFTKVPMREELSRGFTVPCSINGHASRVMVDTGAFLTTFDHAAAKSLGITTKASEITGSFADGIARPMSFGQFNQFSIGNFKLPPQRLAAAVLPDFALQHGNTQVAGLLGIELLVFNHGIIDFDSMSLFLK